MNQLTTRGVAFSCDPNGVVLQVLKDDLGIGTLPGASFADMVDVHSAEKARNFLLSLRERKSVYGWQMNVSIDQSVRPLVFAGGATGDYLLILAAPSQNSLAGLFEEILNANAEAVQALRALIERERLRTELARDYDLYDELSRLNNELINRERELSIKTAALERVTEEKNRLIGIAAHDLRNPLLIIRGYAELIQAEGQLDGESAEYVDEIARSALYMTELVDELLDNAKVESGQVELNLEPIDLVAAAKHSASINHRRADGKDISLVVDAQVDSMVVNLDPVKLRQIINNLVVNAIKYSESGTTVTLRVRRTDRDAVLEVVDQGIGIPEDQLDRIFQPFTALQKSGTAGESAIGLGLSIVKRLVELHGGTIQVQSRPGAGSTFTVAFPLPS